MRTLKFLIWLYCGLLLIEGALRKWFLPQLSDPLLIMRDPIVILIYLQAYRVGRFPSNFWLIAIGVLAFGAMLLGLFAEFVDPCVIGFGLRTDFLHWPLMFVLPQVFDEADVKKVGRVFLLLALPMTLLMVLQFRANPQDWLNAGAGGGGQISAAMGKIRPAGTFSFISGPVLFFAAVTAFVLFNQVAKDATSFGLSTAAGGAVLLACAVSGSRSMLGAVGVVAVALAAGLFLQPHAGARAIRLAVVLGVLFLLISSTKIFRHGTEVLTARITNAAGAEGGLGLRGLVKRFVGGFAAPIVMLFDVPLFGHGLGLGTNGGAALVGVRGRFLLAENEWDRVLMESGPLIGVPYVLLRALVGIHLGWLARRSAAEGRLLPLLLFGAGGLSLVNGQWGQPTTQGFASFLGGLCLAAMETSPLSLERTAGACAVDRLAPARLMPASRVAAANLGNLSRADAFRPGRFAIRS